jgi:hypothetical protein
MFVCSISHADDYLSVGSSNRVDSVSSAIGASIANSIYAEASFIDEGKQPGGIKNVNRLVDIDLVKTIQFGSFYASTKAGLTSSYFSHNGSGNSYENHTGFSGQNIGVNIGYNISKTVSIELSDNDSRYLQCDHHAYESFNIVSVGVKFSF